jgi:hypothetical protein
MKFFKVVAFPQQQGHGIPTQLELFLPLDAISHLTQREIGNPKSGFNIHVKKNYPFNAQYEIKSCNPGYFTNEQVDLIK